MGRFGVFFLRFRNRCWLFRLTFMIASLIIVFLHFIIILSFFFIGISCLSFELLIPLDSFLLTFVSTVLDEPTLTPSFNNCTLVTTFEPTIRRCQINGNMMKFLLMKQLNVVRNVLIVTQFFILHILDLLVSLF